MILRRLAPALLACAVAAPALAEGHLDLFAQIEALADLDGPTEGALEGVAKVDLSMTEDCALTFSGTLVEFGAFVTLTATGNLAQLGETSLQVADGEQTLFVTMSGDARWDFSGVIPAEHPSYGYLVELLAAGGDADNPDIGGTCDEAKCDFVGRSPRAEIPLVNIGDTDPEAALATFQDLVTACKALQ